ncbi:unnamed protein product [Pelagomonas calceolata]|uniref:acetyl-CoA C-acyltransferase n=1 Tax=Pelagomonas calceolata TaxID=35677 RepID=A0A7S3ZZ14_9STRA|nr:unnamed protein product [Pelagomonas calceolata]
MLRAAALRRGLSTSQGKRVVVVDGARIPFAMAGTKYKDQMAVDLMRYALRGLLTKTALPVTEVDYVLCGTVVQEPRTSNIAREAAMHAGLPHDIPAHTVSLACVSANAAICQGAEKILAGQADVVIAGGCETFSDVPIRYSRPIRKRLLGAAKAMKKGPMGALSLLKGLKLKDLAPEAPSIKNFTTDEVMGHSSDRLATKFGVTREEQDKFTLRSHQNAQKAHDDGVYAEELVPGVEGDADLHENGIKAQSTPEQLAKLKPAFVKNGAGTHTAANSSFLTDGAAATLIMSESKALELGYAPKAYLNNWTFAAVDPFEEMLLGPTYATAKVLDMAGVSLDDIDVVEFHEAFAGQVLANFNAMSSDEFGREKLGRQGAVGTMNMDKVNPHGGSLSLGHPFGATGARLVTTAANRLQREGGKLALVAACADGGVGHACVLERYPQ